MDLSGHLLHDDADFCVFQVEDMIDPVQAGVRQCHFELGARLDVPDHGMIRRNNGAYSLFLFGDGLIFRKDLIGFLPITNHFSGHLAEAPGSAVRKILKKRGQYSAA